MGVRHLAVDRDGARDQLDRILVAPRRMGERAAQVQGMCILRLVREHLRIELVRLRELPGLVMPEAGLQDVGRTGHAE
jgi:hypothetical protein